MTGPVDPAEFYTGLVADLYRPLRGSATDPEPYARLLRSPDRQPALELGCGDGDPLLELRRRGLDVEGVDSSAEMLDRCRRRAVEEGVEVVLHHQRMESLDLGRRFRTIFLAGPTFNLLADDDTAAAALGRIGTHLDEDGLAVIPLFVPPPIRDDELGRVRDGVDADGRTIRFRITSVVRDEHARRQEAATRYERIGAETEVVERPWVLHWHTPDGFRALALAAGFTTVDVTGADGGALAPDSTSFVFRLAMTRPAGSSPAAAPGGARPTPPR